MKNTLIFAVVLFSYVAYGQDATTFILIRHAEKVADATQNPGLTKEGEARAQRLVNLLAKENVTAIYSTDFKRTKQTVNPLSEIKGLEIKLYEWKNPKALANKIIEANAGGTVVISGHSNTTPILANFLTGNANLEPFDEDDYGNILIVTTSKVGAGKLVHLQY